MTALRTALPDEDAPGLLCALEAQLLEALDGIKRRVRREQQPRVPPHPLVVQRRALDHA